MRKDTMIPSRGYQLYIHDEDDKADSNECIVDAYFKAHPEEIFAMISCSCPKCSPRC